MTSSQTRPGRAAFAALAALLSFSAFAWGQTVATPPVGYMTYSLKSGTTTPVGISLRETVAFTGPASGVTSATLTVAQSAWTPSQFAAPGAPHFVTILSGSQTGRTLLITANTANSVTLEVGDTGLDATVDFKVGVGDRFEIAAGDTLGTLFGSTVGTVALKGGGSALVADTVQIYNGVRWVPYFFNTTLGYWVMSGDSQNKNDLVLYPDRGLMVARRGEDTSIIVTGRVPVTKLLTKMPGGTGNAVAVRFPTDTTLKGLNFSNPGTWISADSPFLADNVNIWNGIRWVSYWKRTNGQWAQVNGDGSDQGELVIPAGSMVTILKRGSNSGVTAHFTQELPYSL